MRTLLHGGVVVTCDESQTVLPGGDLVLDDERLVYVGPRYDGPYDARISVSGRLLMPGLVNVHTHSGMSIFRSLADDVDLAVFLQERVWPRELRLTGADVYAGSRLSAVEMLKSGVTSFVDMYFYEEDLVRAVLDTGIRALIPPTILSAPVWEPIRGTWEQQLSAAAAFCATYQGMEGRVHTGLAPHAPYTVPMEALDVVAAEARRLEVPVHIHLVETSQERDQFNARWGASTVHVLSERGFFEAKVIAAHCVWLDPGDLEIFERLGVGVAHCPQSNAKLGAGIAPAAEMVARRVRVGLGTDGAATNNNLNLWEEVRLAPLLAKVAALDPKPLRAAEALLMGTRWGAEAAHLPSVGVLQEGCYADVVAMRLDDTTTVPIFRPETYIDHLVYSIGRELVDRVWVHGRLVVNAGEVLTVDEEEVRREAQAAADAVSARMDV